MKSKAKALVYWYTNTAARARVEVKIGFQVDDVWVKRKSKGIDIYPDRVSPSCRGDSQPISGAIYTWLHKVKNSNIKYSAGYNKDIFILKA